MGRASRRGTWVAALALVLAITVLLAAVSAAAAPSPSPAGGLTPPVLRLGYSSDFGNLNPFVDYLSWEVFDLNYNFMTWYDEDYQPVPELASSWEHNAEGTVWTFHIRDDVKWSDGQPLTAKDIAFTYNYVLDNQIYAFMSFLGGVKKVEAPDDATVVITSGKPNPMMLHLYVPIVPEHVWKDIDGKKLDSLKNPPTVGSGPFRITEYEPGVYLKMTANPGYFGGRPNVNTVMFNIYTDEDGLVQDFKAGNVDIGVLQVPTSLRAVAGVSGSMQLTEPTVGFIMLGINCWTSPKSKGNPLLTDVRVRRAIALAIDKENVNAASMSGVATVATSVLSPAMGDWHWQPSDAELLAYDPAEAEATLEAAGYTDRNGDGVRENAAGKPLDFKLDLLSDYPSQVNAGKMIATYLKSVGIRTRIEVISEAAFSDRIYNNQGVDLYIWGWGGDLDPSYQLSAFTTDQILWNNDCCYSNSEYDELFEQQSTTIDHAARVDIVHRMQQILYNDSPYVVLWYATNMQAYRADEWTGWQLAPPEAPSVMANYLRGTYMGVKPASASTSSGSGGTSATPIVAGIVVAGIVVAGVVLLVIRRRRPGEEESA